MAFDIESFKQDAVAKGYKEEEVNKFLKQRAGTDKDINFSLERDRASKTAMGRFLSSEIIPGALATAGGLAGSLLGPVGAFGGAAAGYGGGKAIQDTALRVSGVRQRTPQMNLQETGDVAKGAAIAGGTNLALYGAGKLIPKVLSPIKTTKEALSGIRTKAIGGKTLPTESVFEPTGDVVSRLKASDYYKAAPVKVQKQAEKALLRLKDVVAPLETSGTGGSAQIAPPTDVGINRLYQGTSAVEKGANAYGSETPLAAGTKLATGAVRDYLSENISPVARGANKLYGGVAGNEALIKKALAALLVLAPAYAYGSKIYSNFKQ